MKKKWTTSTFTEVVSGSIIAGQPSVYSNYFPSELMDCMGIQNMSKTLVGVVTI